MTEPKDDSALDFGKSAGGYARARRGYPNAVFDHLSQVSPDRAQVLELGAGSGQATAALAARFDQVIAVEPDARLIGEATFAENVTILNKSAEGVDFEHAVFDAVISATAFHWMDQPTLCAAIARWLKPGGIFFPFAYSLFDYPATLKSLEEQEQKKWAPYRDQRLVNNYDYPAVLEKSKMFTSVVPYTIMMKKDYTPLDAAVLMATTSFGSAYARDHKGGVDNYVRFLTEQIEGLTAPSFTIGFPIIGAVGVCA